MKVIRPFGPTIAKVKIPDQIIQELNEYVDKIIIDEKKLKDLDYGKKLAGNVKQEFTLEKDFLVLSGWENFLKDNAEKWINDSVKKKITEFNVISSWIVRQFSNEYNPIHYHSGHISGVGYLKLPKTFGKTIQGGKVNHNGYLELIHGSAGFLSPSTLHIKPEVGDFYFFPNYLMHCVYPFENTSEERRSISFNAYVNDNIYNSLPDV